MIQLKSLNKIHVYLIHLNNEHQAMKNIKESMIKVRMTKQVIFAEKLLKTIFYKTVEATKSVDLLKQCDATLTNVKDIDLQIENCFHCYKSDHIFKECSD